MKKGPALLSRCLLPSCPFGAKLARGSPRCPWWHPTASTLVEQLFCHWLNPTFRIFVFIILYCFILLLFSNFLSSRCLHGHSLTAPAPSEGPSPFGGKVAYAGNDAQRPGRDQPGAGRKGAFSSAPRTNRWVRRSNSTTVFELGK